MYLLKVINIDKYLTTVSEFIECSFRTEFGASNYIMQNYDCYYDRERDAFYDCNGMFVYKIEKVKLKEE